MTECCNSYGVCEQGRDCPARTGTVTREQARNFIRRNAPAAGEAAGYCAACIATYFAGLAAFLTVAHWIAPAFFFITR